MDCTHLMLLSQQQWNLPNHHTKELCMCKNLMSTNFFNNVKCAEAHTSVTCPSGVTIAIDILSPILLTLH